MKNIFEYDSPIGTLTLASDGASITGLWMQGQKYYGQNLDANATEKELPVFDQAREWLDRYFAGAAPDLTLPLSPNGRDFSMRVWRELRKIPHGETTTYGAIAKKIAAQLGIGKVAPRAVGYAVSHNPISIIIPCHRVLGANGGLTGFAGGLDKKQWLLRHEKSLS